MGVEDDLMIEALGSEPDRNMEYLVFAFTVYYEAFRHSIKALSSRISIPLEH